MLDLGLRLPEGRPPRLLFLGAHSDDIEIGCGGTVLQLPQTHPDAQVQWVVFSAEPGRKQEARSAAAVLLRGADSAEVAIEDFRGAYFPAEFTALKDRFEQLKQEFVPDVVFTHLRDDLHQDHRIIGELTWNTFRDHLILEYEIPKYDGGLGAPSVFVPLRAETVRAKVELLMSVFETQRSRPWFTPATFEGLMRLRGIECNAASGYAEAFYCRKAVLGFG